MPNVLHSRPTRPLLLLASLLLAGAIALSIHVGMLAAGVPLPISAPPGWARWLNLSLAIGAVLVLLKLAAPQLRHRSVLARTLITFAILLTIRETVRGAVMTGVVTSGWIFGALGLIEPWIRLLIVAMACVLAVRRVRGAFSLVGIALATGGVCFGAHMLVGMALAPLAEYAAAFGRPDQYVFPYPAAVLVPAYLTMIEPVLGATLMLTLAWNQLPASPVARLLSCALLVATVKGTVGLTFLFSFFMQQPPLAGMLSHSQFLFEFLALGFLVGLAWDSFGPRRTARLPPGLRVV